MRATGTLATTAVWLSAIGASACGASQDDDGATSRPVDTPTRTPTTTSSAAATASAPSARVSRAIRALKAAQRQVSRGTPYDLETERYKRKPVWEIKVAKGKQRPYTVYVSANGKKIERRTRSRKRGDDAPKALQAKISLARALRTADTRADGTLDEAEIDRTSNGTLVWEATFEGTGGSETEVSVNAKTGKVIRIERGDD